MWQGHNKPAEQRQTRKDVARRISWAMEGKSAKQLRMKNVWIISNQHEISANGVVLTLEIEQRHGAASVLPVSWPPAAAVNLPISQEREQRRLSKRPPCFSGTTIMPMIHPSFSNCRKHSYIVEPEVKAMPSMYWIVVYFYVQCVLFELMWVKWQGAVAMWDCAIGLKGVGFV